jgi:carbon storage regulator
MLVLTRKAGEGVHVGTDVVVRVVKIEGNKVVMGFSAPNETKILRTEIVEREAGRDAA